MGKSTTLRKKTAGSGSKPRKVRAAPVEVDDSVRKDPPPNEQVKLPPPELKILDVMTKDQELQLEFLRISQAKKEVLRQEHIRKMQARREEEELMSGGSSGDPLSQDGGASVKPPPPNPVKLEKLPPTYRLPRTNLDLTPSTTRENDYARLIKALHTMKKKQTSLSNLGQPSVNSQVQKSQVSLLDPLNLIRSSGITVEHNPENIQKPIFMEPPSKTLKATFGVHYKEPKVAIDGEPYENRPDEKKRMTRSQFLEMSAMMDSKVLRDTNVSASIDGGEFSKMLLQQDSMDTTIALPTQGSVQKQLNNSQQSFNLQITLNDSHQYLNPNS